MTRSVLSSFAHFAKNAWLQAIELFERQGGESLFSRISTRRPGQSFPNVRKQPGANGKRVFVFRADQMGQVDGELFEHCHLRDEKAQGFVVGIGHVVSPVAVMQSYQRYAEEQCSAFQFALGGC